MTHLRTVFYVCLFNVRLPVDDLKEIETCRSLSGLYVIVHILIFVNVFVLTVRLIINESN